VLTGYFRAPDPAVLILRGDDAGEFLDGQVTNDVGSLEDGESRYALLLTPKGKLRADMRIVRDGGDTLVITTTEHLPTIRKTVDTFRIGYFFETIDVSGQFALVGVVSDHAREQLDAAGKPEVVLDSPLGADALVPTDAVAAFALALESAGLEQLSNEQVALARVEGGIPEFGAELNEDTFPAEAGLEQRAVSFEKGCYVGQETVARMHYKGKPNRHLRLLSADAPLTPGDPVVAPDGRELGRVGTAVISPDRGAIALAILRREGEIGEQVSAGGVAATIAEV
jgi:folate-binding protein YgfZ